MFKPYSNDDDVLNIQGDALTVSNGTTRVVLNGTLELTQDQRGLKAAEVVREAAAGGRFSRFRKTSCRGFVTFTALNAYPGPKNASL